MNKHAASLSVIACAALGCWLPSLWLAAPPEKTRALALSLPPSATPSSSPGLAGAVRSADSFMDKLQAVMAGAVDRRIGPSSRPEDMSGFGFDLAEELAASLAGEAAGRNVRDRESFLKYLRETDSEAFGDAALAAWAEADPDAAMATLLGSGSPRLHGHRAGFKALAAKYPDKLLAALRAGRNHPVVRYAWKTALEVFAEQSPDFALDALLSAPGEVRSQGMDSILGTFAAKDPRAALAWLEKLPSEKRSLASPDAGYTQWLAQDPAAAVEAWLAAGHDISGNPGDQLISTWAEHDPDTYLEWSRGKGEAGESMQDAAVTTLAETDGPRAVSMLSELEPDAQKSILSDIAQNWARYDAPAALAWARTLSPVERLPVIMSMFSKLDGLPPEDLLAVAEGTGVETRAGFAILRQVDPAEAEIVLATMPREDARVIAKEMANDLQYSAPAAAAHYLELLIAEGLPPPAPDEFGRPSDQKLSGMVSQVTASWTAQDPAAAAAWVNQLPPGFPQVTAAANVALTWGRHDLPAARAWIEQMPEGPARDKAAEQIARIAKTAGE